MDLVRLDRILSGLPADDAAFLSSLLEPPWMQRARRLRARDETIRAALALLESSPNPVARLVELMNRQARDRRSDRPAGDYLLVAAVTKVLTLNDGLPLGERQVRNIAAGTRTPVQ